jgi:hypothetical protein
MNPRDQWTPGKEPPTTAIPGLWLICLRNAGSHCLASDPVLNDLISATITGAINIGVGIIIWKLTRNPKGDTTGQDEGIYKGKHEKPSEFGECFGANTSGDRAFLSRPSRCFGNSQTSWLPSSDGNLGYDLFSLGAGHSEVLANLNTRNGAFAYVKPDSEPGLWTTWGFKKIANCVALF